MKLIFTKDKNSMQSQNLKIIEATKYIFLKIYEFTKPRTIFDETLLAVTYVAVEVKLNFTSTVFSLDRVLRDS